MSRFWLFIDPLKLQQLGHHGLPQISGVLVVDILGIRVYLQAGGLEQALRFVPVPVQLFTIGA